MSVNSTTPPSPPAINNLCPTCGTVLQPYAAFCTHCGHPLGEQPIAPAGLSKDATPPGLQLMSDTLPPPLPPAAPTGPVTQFCQNCGKGLPADIAICPDCSGTEFDPI
jgi:predicted amidophosphoribosyltransferase